jgi:hypothetical protein
MAYLGNNLQVAYPSYRTIDDISSQFNGVLKTFALQIGGVAAVPFPINPQQCLISVNGVIQKPDSTGTTGFTLTGANIVFASAPSAGWAFFGTVLAGADYVNVGANFPSGTAAVPSVTFDQSTGTGLYLASSNVLGIATSGVQQLTVDSSGNVSITGIISAAAGTAAAPAYRFTGDTNTGIYSPGADQVAISTNGTERMRIQNDGKVLIGTTSISGANYGTKLILSTNSGTNRWEVGPYNTATSFIIAPDTNYGVYLPNTTSTSWTSASDERIKTELEPIEDGLAKVATLRAVTGRFVFDKDGPRKVFLIAQDVLEVLPEAVDTSNPERYGLAYTEVIPLLVAALKESKERIETLETRLSALESA